jgi:hypothetical protein
LVAQRLAAQPPGRNRFVAAILAGFYKHNSVFSLGALARSAAAACWAAIRTIEFSSTFQRIRKLLLSILLLLGIGLVLSLFITPLQNR